MNDIDVHAAGIRLRVTNEIIDNHAPFAAEKQRRFIRATLPRSASPPIYSISPSRTRSPAFRSTQFHRRTVPSPSRLRSLDTPDSLGFIGSRALRKLLGCRYNNQTFELAAPQNCIVLSMDIRRILTQKIVADNKAFAVTSGDQKNGSPANEISVQPSRTTRHPDKVSIPVNSE